MKFIRSLAWWMNKAADENETVGAASPRSKKTLSPIELTDEEKAHLLSLARRSDESDGSSQADAAENTNG